VEHVKAAQRELEPLLPEWQSLYYRAQFVAAIATYLASNQRRQDLEEYTKTLLHVFQVCRDKESQAVLLSELATDILVELWRWGRHIRRESAGGIAPSAGYESFSKDEYLNYVTKNGLLKAKGVRSTRAYTCRVGNCRKSR
jgi:hypothetical protein